MVFLFYILQDTNQSQKRAVADDVMHTFFVLHFGGGLSACVELSSSTFKRHGGLFLVQCSLCVETMFLV